ncbi:MAG: T9SS type A sorting domain-containing protein [Ignavibacteria bacterium]|nr:T9SS type A sorting domain-containing protein [Ignavibacteria bacterium]
MRKILSVLFFVLLFSQNGLFAQWVNVSNGLGNKQVYSMTNNGSVLFAGTFNYGLYMSSDNGLNWTMAGIGLNNRIVFSLTTFSGYLYAGTDLGVWKTSNNGAYWIVTSINNNTVYSLASNSTRVFAGLHLSGLFYSTGGTGWMISSLNITDIKSLAINGNFLLAGGGNNAGVHLSNNNGNNWSSTSLNNKSVHSLALNGSNAFAGTGSGIYRSLDSGHTWTQTAINDQLIYSLAVYGNNVFAGSETNGVYFSGNNGLNWVQVNDGLGSNCVYSLYIFNNYVFAGVAANSVYRRPLGELVGISGNETTYEYSLSQNYPNPFNPVTRISYSIQKQSVVSLKIFDNLGKEIRTIINELKNAGRFSAEFDGSELPSGIYYCRLQAGNFIGVRKMMLVK